MDAAKNLPRGAGGASWDLRGRDNASASWDAGHGDARDAGARGDSRGRDDNDGRGHGGNAGAVGDGRGDGLLGNRNGRIRRNDLRRAGLGLRLDVAGLRLGDDGDLRVAGERDDGGLGGHNGVNGDDGGRGERSAVLGVAVGDGHVLGRPGGSLLAVDGAGLGDDTTVLTGAVGDVGAAGGDGDGLGRVDGLLGLGDGQSGTSDNGERSSGETHLD